MSHTKLTLARLDSLTRSFSLSVWGNYWFAFGFKRSHRLLWNLFSDSVEIKWNCAHSHSHTHTVVVSLSGSRERERARACLCHTYVFTESNMVNCLWSASTSRISDQCTARPLAHTQTNHGMHRLHAPPLWRNAIKYTHKKDNKRRDSVTSTRIREIQTIGIAPSRLTSNTPNCVRFRFFIIICS